MSSAPHGDTVDLRNVYDDLAMVLGSAHHRARLASGSPDQLAAVNQAVQQLWSLTVQRLGASLERADPGDLPPVVVEPDLQATADLDVDAILDHVAAFEPAAATPQQSRSLFDLAGSVRTATLVWCAVAAVLAVFLGVTVTGPVVVALLFIACLAGLLWRWPAAAALTGLAPLLELSPSSITANFVNHGLVYAVLTARWARAIFHGPWPASRLSVTELGLARSGRELRGGWRVAQRSVENTLSQLASPRRGDLFHGLGGSGSSGYRC